MPHTKLIGKIFCLVKSIFQNFLEIVLAKFTKEMTMNTVKKLKMYNKTNNNSLLPLNKSSLKLFKS